MIATILMFAGLYLGAPQPQEAPFAWLIGKWCTLPHAPAKGTTCEEWTPMADGVMRGTSQTRREGKPTQEEKMEIRRDGAGWIFHAEPRGQAPADFRAGADDVAALAVSFENAAHDYPQRIRYWRDGDMLIAEIALADGNKAIRWEYHREK
ncbi:DUF6265 family protein [Sphingomonas sp. HITSZ_GF]|uniref:DUF6265 family protein n=1 Tax=Sphingomonas sp. HITSZ_GF TaxID=3037247 RepID=UPI00240DA49D|nr:DUF6265 family protein [Sphingomonas sp. HITSZ_GF]MDG2534758.1 DUF6265 family protein [Sphingomonas sp. HITSZ_GF]